MLIEMFINPSMVDPPRIEDEYTYGLAAKQNPEMIEKMKKHWDTWLTEEDVILMNQIGINYVRLPIGNYLLCESK